MASHFPDGVYFVDLAPVESTGDIVQAIAESLGILLSADADLKSQLMAYLAGKRQLLVLDNFEHLVSGAVLVTEALKSAPELKIIVTSRSKLNVSGETVQALMGLKTSWVTNEEAFQTGGVQLFTDAARRADASFVLAQADLGPLGQILKTVGGMPLGIELAAACVDVLAVEEIAAEIAKTLDFLESETGDVPDRHRSIRAVFDYSWTMSSSEERQTFCALSVFRGGFTRRAAEAVTGASIRGLANLTAKSLLVSDRDTGRYVIHELLRQYAEAALREDSRLFDATASAHAGFFTSTMSQAEEMLPTDEMATMRVVEDDLDNIRSAWRHSLAKLDGDSTSKFVVGLRFLHEIRGWVPTGRCPLRRGVGRLPRGAPRRCRPGWQGPGSRCPRLVPLPCR